VQPSKWIDDSSARYRDIAESDVAPCGESGQLFRRADPELQAKFVSPKTSRENDLD
jgi:hypothetical protein